ncbi:MAG: C-type lectin domain-containing protein [Anaerolineales bacterium]
MKKAERRKSDEVKLATLMVDMERGSMKENWQIIAICFLIIGLFVSSCGPGQLFAPTPTPTPTTTNTSRPTITLILTPTPTHTPSSTLTPTDIPILNTYKIFYTVMSWHDAQDHCLALEAHLVTINSKPEYIFVKDLAYNTSDSTDDIFWIGMSDEAQEGIWKWVTDEPVTFNDWGVGGEPDNCSHGCGDMPPFSREEDYAFMSKNPGWDDVYDIDIGFICEWERTE